MAFYNASFRIRTSVKANYFLREWIVIWRWLKTCRNICFRSNGELLFLLRGNSHVHVFKNRIICISRKLSIFWLQTMSYYLVPVDNSSVPCRRWCLVRKSPIPFHTDENRQFYKKTEYLNLCWLIVVLSMGSHRCPSCVDEINPCLNLWMPILMDVCVQYYFVFSKELQMLERISNSQSVCIC